MNLALYLHTGGAAGLLATLVVAGVIIWLVFYVIPLPPIVRTILGVVVAVGLILLLLPGCNTLAAYNSHVAARQDSLSGYDKDGNYGGAFTHRAEYKP